MATKTRTVKAAQRTQRGSGATRPDRPPRGSEIAIDHPPSQKVPVYELTHLVDAWMYMTLDELPEVFVVEANGDRWVVTRVSR